LLAKSRRDALSCQQLPGLADKVHWMNHCHLVVMLVKPA